MATDGYRSRKMSRVAGQLSLEGFVPFVEERRDLALT